MPLHAKNVIVKTKESKVEEKKKGPGDRLVPTSGTALFVNGKERKIGKKSQYLLDMLTLDDK